MSMTRRQVLRGLGGACLALPWLESFVRAGRVQAQSQGHGFAVFLRQANGVASAQSTQELGSEPERFWPRQTGALTADTLQGRALAELDAFRSKLLVAGGVNMSSYDYGDGHARGAMQGLTARGPTVPGQGGNSEAAGESIDHRIGVELNPEGRDSLFLYAGRNAGWLGGACISYRGPGQRRAPFNDPANAYDAVAGVAAVTPEAQSQLVERRKSVNDLVREQLQAMLRHPRLSQADRQRLDLHLSNVRDIEVEISCRLREDQEAALDGFGAAYESDDGDQVLATARLHMDIAAAAIACGYTRSVAIQVGNGNDGITRYRSLDDGAQMENYHYISHRRLSHDSSGAVISNSDVLHHHVDRQFAQTFRHLLERLDAYQMPNGGTLLDQGVAVWYNDNGNGPGHSSRNVPFILAGSGSGLLRQGQYLRLDDGGANHHRMLATLASAAGVRKSDGALFDSFGDPGLGGGLLDALLA